ncbi:MAG: apolipoprotein N-acyltransferase, partial [bacterium]
MGLLLSIISGLLAGFSFPKYGYAILAWVSYVPLLFSIKTINGKRPVLRAYFYGFISGFIANIILLYWVVVAMHRYGNINLIVSIFGLFLLASILSALYWGPFTLLIKVFMNDSRAGELIFIPVIWVILEYIRTFLFSGFPWELLGYSQYKNLSLIQIARWTSVYGVSFLIMLFNVIVYELIVWWYNVESVRTKQYPMMFAKTIIVVLLITGVFVYGDITLSNTNREIKQATDVLTVGLIQGNIDQNHKWDPVYQNETMTSYFSLSQQAYNLAHPELIIWPETATPFFFQTEYNYREQLIRFVKAHNVYLLFGSPAFDYTKNGINYYNSAFMLSPDGSVIGRYDKRHLVPFGEYLPLKHIFFFLRKLTEGIGDFTPGRQYNLLEFQNVRIGTLICYEIIFPQLSAHDVRDGANLLVTITDDAWFGDTSAPYQHLSMATFRAVENNRFVVRAANTGITAVISPTGEIMKSTKLFVPGFIDYRVALLKEKTFYTVHGDIFVFVSMGIFAIFIIRYIYRHFTVYRLVNPKNAIGKFAHSFNPAIHLRYKDF